jgi:hypothetical protein
LPGTGPIGPSDTLLEYETVRLLIDRAAAGGSALFSESDLALLAWVDMRWVDMRRVKGGRARSHNA